MAWTKLKTTVVAAAVVLLAAGTTTVAIKEVKARQTRARPTPGSIFIPGGAGSFGTRLTPLPQSILQMMANAYQIPMRHTIVATDLPTGKYAFEDSHSSAAMKQEMKNRFGLIGRVIMVQTNVLLLTVRQANAKGLQPGTKGNNPGGLSGFAKIVPGSYQSQNQPITALTRFLEGWLNTVVLDKTGLTGTYDISMKWQENDPKKHDPAAIKQALLDDLGLGLAESDEQVEMLIIEKAK